MLTSSQITDIFFLTDDFCKEIDQFIVENPFSNHIVKPKYIDLAKFSLSPSEILTLQICFQHSGFRSLKSFYIDFVSVYLKNDFPSLPSYNRFVELQKMVIFHNFLFTKFCCLGKCDGISFIDSFRLAVCNNRRIHQHKVFNSIAQRGHTSMGFFYGFKGHIVINSDCEIVDFQLTPGDIADNNTDLLNTICANVFGKIYGDKGYIINPEKFERFFEKGIQFVTKIRSNMKNRLMDLNDKFMLKRRNIVETVIDQLKNICQIEHSRHRNPVNFFNNFLSAIAAYSIKTDKPKITKSKAKVNYFSPFQLSLDL